MQLTTDLKGLASVRAFRTLLVVRLLSQTGDGMVQVGLATLFFFQAHSMATASGVATALVVMLLPFSVVGPLTGPLIDRWRRRQTLLYGNLARAGLIAATAVVLRVLGRGPLLYVLVLVALGTSRFLLSVLSAGLPQVVARERLLVANSVVPTLGGAATALGAVIGVLLRLLLPEGSPQETASLVTAVLLYCGAALVVTRLRPDQLGPDGREGNGGTGLGAGLVAAAADLVDAVVYLVRRGTPGLALTTMALHRFVYGMEVVTVILVARNLLAAPQDADRGLALFGVLMGAMVAGHGVAVVLTPLAHERVSPSAWVVACLVGGSAGQLVLVATYDQYWMTGGLLVFGTGVQGAKIAVDTIVQSDTADFYRGRAFSIYDVLFNTAECVAAGAAVLVLPGTGWSVPVQAALVVLVWVVAAAYWWLVRALGGVPRAVAAEAETGSRQQRAEPLGGSAAR
ncbi:MFS transporter [Actinomyces sp. 2119]|uniref:MFS transporter n=1 Tax=Actinomyces sp. 2119 TaxID=2321393 RepID=UPI000E6D5549|nr:MFS transporter [Actinomyces sp. 2119]RJF43870.1 MFS transporter [Actinomyces sp. 2119]